MGGVVGGIALFRTPRACWVTQIVTFVGGWVAILHDGDQHVTGDDLRALAALVAIAMLDIELGRRAENGRLVGQRPHKGLSAWPFAAILLVPHSAAVAVVIPVYAYARWRGLRPQLWKWVGSGGILVISAAVSQEVLRALDQPLVSGWGPLAVVVAIAAFLTVEAAGFWVCSAVNEPVDEAWLRAQLQSVSFYANELAVLAQGTVLAMLWTARPVLVLFLLPSYAVLQRALLHAPLRDEADHDAKTGLLTLPAWQRSAQRDLLLGRPCAVLLADLDHFKRLNDRHGHLVGDLVLRAVAQELQTGVRLVDVVGRFGGEEFCLFLPEADAAAAVATAERLRQSIAALTLTASPGVTTTMSVGVCSADRVEPGGLTRILGLADEQLYAAKSAGRNCVRAIHVTGAPPPEVVVPATRRATDSDPSRR